MASNNNENQFSKFISNLKTINSKTSAFCQSRQLEIKEKALKKLIMLQQIENNEEKHPIKMLDPSYSLDNNTKQVLMIEFKDLHNLSFSNDKFDKIIINKCEKYEEIKKIIDTYLSFMVELNFESIINSLKKLNLIESEVVSTLIHTKKLKHKIKLIKNNFLSLGLKFLLAKQKQKNLNKLKEFSRGKLYEWYENNKKIEQKIEKNEYYEASQLINMTLNELSQSKVNLGRLYCFQTIFQTIHDKQTLLSQITELNFSSIFIEKNQKYNELYQFNISQYNLDEYLNKYKSTFKSSIFRVFKKILINSDNKNICSSDDINKLNDFQKYITKMEDSKFLISIQQILLSLTKISQNFRFYLEIHNEMKFENHSDQDKNLKFITELEKIKSSFLQIIEKKLSKLYRGFKGIIKELKINSLITFTVYNSFFIDNLLKLFDSVECSILKNNLKECILDNIKNQSISIIRTLFIILGEDSWKRLPLYDSKLFDEEKVKEIASFSMMKYITHFNSNSENLNIDIDDFFKKASENYYIRTKNDFPISILSKNIDFKKIILSSSSFSFFKSILIYVAYFNLFDKLTFEIFQQLFNVVDYYIFSGISMLQNKDLIKKLLLTINPESLRKNATQNQSQRIEKYVETILFQQNFIEIKRFLEKMNKNLEVLFEVDIDLLRSDSNNTSGFQFPVLNNQVFVSDVNSYSLMAETMILYESIYSIIKVLTRMIIHTNKIEDVEQRNKIQDEIRKYKVLIKNLQFYLYKPICQSIFKIDTILNKIKNFKWDPKESEINSQFTEPSAFVDLIFEEISEKYYKIDVLLAGSMNEKAKKRFLMITISYFVEKIMESIAVIKKCNSSGRGLMLKDVKFLKNKLESKFMIDITPLIKELDMYLNSWYCEERDLLEYILEQNVNYKYISGIVHTGSNFEKLDKNEKKNLWGRIDETYISLVEKISKLIN